MSITKAMRKLSPQDRQEAKELISELVETDGMSREAAAIEALNIIRDEAEKERETLIERMKK